MSHVTFRSGLALSIVLLAAIAFGGCIAVGDGGSNTKVNPPTVGKQLTDLKEAHDKGMPDNRAVSIGLERTGRIVTAAALLFSVAIGAFVTSKLVFIKELGLGIALAVLIDAFVIRALLVPSLMALLGRWNWWAPGPLRRLYERSTHTPAKPALRTTE